MSTQCPLKEKPKLPIPGAKKGVTGPLLSKLSGVPRFEDTVPPLTHLRIANYVDPADPHFVVKLLCNVRLVKTQQTRKHADAEIGKYLCPWLRAGNVSRRHLADMLLKHENVMNPRILVCHWGCVVVRREAVCGRRSGSF